jgi:hypothetical protein
MKRYSRTTEKGNSTHKDAIGMDSDRSDRQQANSSTRQTLHRMYSPSTGWSPAARLLSGPGHPATIVPNKAAYRCAVCLAAECRMCPR